MVDNFRIVKIMEIASFNVIDKLVGKNNVLKN